MTTNGFNTTDLVLHAALYLAAGLALMALSLAVTVLSLFPPARRFVWAALSGLTGTLITVLLALELWFEAKATPPAQQTGEEARSS